MRVKIYHGMVPVIEMSLELCLCSLYATDITVLNGSGLPAGLRYLMETGGKEAWGISVTHWLKNRSMPDDRYGLDELLQSLYRLPPHLFGRMYPYKYTALALSYFASGFDRYYVSPDSPQTVCHVLQDRRFWGLYTWLPAGPSGPYPDGPGIAGLIKDGSTDSPLFHGSFHTRSLTIPSRLPSWWEGSCLIQRLPADRNRKRAARFLSMADRMGIAGIRHLRGGNLITDYSDITGEVTWLGEFSLCENGQAMREVAAGMLGKDCVGHLLDFAVQAEDAGVNLSIGNLGVASDGERNQCVAIL